MTLLNCACQIHLTIFQFILIYIINLVGCVANEQVAQLSEFSSPELKETILSVVHGLLATLSPKMHSKPSNMSENATIGATNVGSEDCAEVVENSALHFQPVISLTRDYLARLLFWLVPRRFLSHSFISMYVFFYIYILCKN